MTNIDSEYLLRKMKEPTVDSSYSTLVVIPSSELTPQDLAQAMSNPILMNRTGDGGDFFDGVPNED